MAQEVRYNPVQFLYTNNVACREMAESLSGFHQDAMRRSDTYRAMVQTVSQSQSIHVYVRKQLNEDSERTNQPLHRISKKDDKIIEISRKAIDAQAWLAPSTERSDITRALAIRFLIDGVRKACQSHALENRIETAGLYQLEDDMDESVFQGGGNDSTVPWAGGENVLGASSMHTMSRICEEIRDYCVLLS